MPGRRQREIRAGVRRARGRRHAGAVRGFTFVELLVSVMLACLAMLVVMRMIGAMRDHWQVGTVNLNQLQEARMALAWLQRDFICACPRFDQRDSLAVRERLRLDPFQLDGAPVTGQLSEPIVIRPDGREVSFWRYRHETSDDVAEPTVERVSYSLDTTAGELHRNLPTQLMKFLDFQDVEFRLYVSEVDPTVPVLWVRMKIIDRDEAARTPTAKPLEICTSISSAFSASALRHPYWNFRTTMR